MTTRRVVDHRGNFEVRRQRLPFKTKYLVDLVLARILPCFEERGFVWYPDFAGGRPIDIGSNEIPLQRRQGEDWPTVQFRFNRHDRPCFSVDFAVLPPLCRELGLQPIPREKALVIHAPAYFMLCKGERQSLDGPFGYRSFSFFPQRFLSSEVDKVVTLLPVLFDLFDNGIPKEWLEAEIGRVAKHIYLMGSWKVWERRRARRAQEKTLGSKET